MQHVTASRLLGLCLFLSVIRTGLSQQDWLSALTQQVFGTTYSARQDNTTRLIQGYYEDPFPQAAPPAAVVVARGELALDHSSDYQERPRSCMSSLVPVYDALKITVILMPSGTPDVIAAVKAARENNLTVAVRGGGHWVVSYCFFQP